jgi:hypothetical protein
MAQKPLPPASNRIPPSDGGEMMDRVFDKLSEVASLAAQASEDSKRASADVADLKRSLKADAVQVACDHKAETKALVQVGAEIGKPKLPMTLAAIVNLIVVTGYVLLELLKKIPHP